MVIAHIHMYEPFGNSYADKTQSASVAHDLHALTASATSHIARNTLSTFSRPFGLRRFYSVVLPSVSSVTLDPATSSFTQAVSPVY